MTFGGLILIALGTGGIKPCVAAFGGDQFKLHQVIKFKCEYYEYDLVFLVARCICCQNSFPFSICLLMLGA